MQSRVLAAMFMTLVMGFAWISKTEASIIITRTNVVVGAEATRNPDDGVVVVDENFNLPFVVSRTATSTTGGSWSSADYDLQASGDSATFNFGFAQTRSGGPDGTTSAFGQIDFTVSTLSHFNLDGFFDVLGGIEASRVHLYAKVHDDTVSGAPVESSTKAAK